MSAERVDVLAVMDHMIRMHEIESGDDLRGERDEFAHQARALVCEMINELTFVYNHGYSMSDHKRIGKILERLGVKVDIA